MRSSQRYSRENFEVRVDVSALRRGLLQPLLDPDVAFATPATSREPSDPATETRKAAVRHLARSSRDAGAWGELADLHLHLAEQAWHQRRTVTCLRLLAAAWRCAEECRDSERSASAAVLLAERHRLLRALLASEAWSRSLVAVEPSSATACHHASALRELAAVKALMAAYDEADSLCAEAIEICLRFPEAPGTRTAHIKALLERAENRRLRGAASQALADVREARRLAGDMPGDALLQGLIELREGGVQLIIGDAAVALAAFRRAESLFRGVSDNNAVLARLRQIVCLRALDRFDEALGLSEPLIEHFQAAGDGQRLGQVLLEYAEVLHDAGRIDRVGETLARAGAYYRDADTLEALRWHRHTARLLIGTGGDAAEAMRHLRVVLEAASRPDRRDLMRTVLALHDLLRLAPPTFDDVAWLAIGRAALVGVEFQRGALDRAGSRWANQALHEEFYAGAVYAHAAAGLADDTVRVIETGRADVLDQLLFRGTRAARYDMRDLPITQPPPDPALLDGVFEVATVVAEALRGGDESSKPRVPLLPLPAQLPLDADLDTFADVVTAMHVGRGKRGWWSVAAVRRRGERWRVTFREAPKPVDALLDRLVAGGLPPARGMRLETWEALSVFLLPGDDVWSSGSAGRRSLLICPDARLWQIPYGALRREGVYLVDQTDIMLAPSLRTLGLLRRRAAVRGTVDRGSLDAACLLDSTLQGYRTGTCQVN